MGTLTLTQLEALLDSIPPEPIGEWMRAQGCPPEKWNLYLPACMRAEFPADLPSYVMFSRAATQPLFARREALGSLTLGEAWENTKAIRQSGEKDEP